SVHILIGCKLERASIHTCDRSGTMTYGATPENPLHLAHLEITSDVGQRRLYDVTHAYEQCQDNQTTDHVRVPFPAVPQTSLTSSSTSVTASSTAAATAGDKPMPS